MKLYLFIVKTAPFDSRCERNAVVASLGFDLCWHAPTAMGTSESRAMRSLFAPSGGLSPITILILPDVVGPRLQKAMRIPVREDLRDDFAAGIAPDGLSRTGVPWIVCDVFEK